MLKNTKIKKVSAVEGETSAEAQESEEGQGYEHSGQASAGFLRSIPPVPQRDQALSASQQGG